MRVPVIGDFWHRLARVELWLLATLLLAAGGLLAFGMLADEILEGDALAFDRAILLALRNPADLSDPVGPRWFEEVARDITALGSHVVLTMVTLAVFGFLLIARKRGAAVLVAVSVGGGTLLSTLLKAVFGRARPDLVPHAVDVYTASFPSGHAMLSAVTYLTLGALLMRVQARRGERVYILAVAVAVTLLVGASRVYLGVHWPSDVLAGWCVGSAWAILCWTAALWLQRRGELDPPPGNGAEGIGTAE